MFSSPLAEVGWLLPVGALLVVILRFRARSIRISLAIACLLLQFLVLVSFGPAGRAVFEEADKEGKNRDAVLWTLRAMDDATSPDRWLALGTTVSIVLLLTTSADRDRGDKH